MHTSLMTPEGELTVTFDKSDLTSWIRIATAKGNSVSFHRITEAELVDLGYAIINAIRKAQEERLRAKIDDNTALTATAVDVPTDPAEYRAIVEQI